MNPRADNKIKLALIVSQPNAASITFIHAHRNKINADVALYSNGCMPTHMNDVCLDRFLHRLEFFCRKKMKLAKFGSYDEFVLARSFKKQKIEIVLAEFGSTGAAMVNVCRKLSIPLLVYFHGYDSSERSVLENHDNYKELFENAAKIFVVSKDMRERLIAMGAPKTKIVLNPCVPDDEFFDVKIRNSTSQTFLAAGRFTNKKAPHLTLLAFQRLLDKYPKAKLVMLGDGALHQVCRDLIKENKIIDRVELPGVYTRDVLGKYLPEACAFVQHSVTAENGDKEGTPVVILEASAAGLPIVSTKHAGIVEAVKDGQTGYLVNEYDVAGMSRAMVKILEDPTAAREMGNNGKKHVKENYNMKNHIATIDKAIQQVLSNEQRKKAS